MSAEVCRSNFAMVRVQSFFTSSSMSATTTDPEHFTTAACAGASQPDAARIRDAAPSPASHECFVAARMPGRIIGK